MKNRVIDHGHCLALALRRRDGGELFALISSSDLGKVESLPSYWAASFNRATGRFRVQGLLRREGLKKITVFLHRFILDAPPAVQVDHINHDELDNRRENIRLVTQSINLQNRAGAERRSRSGVRNVHWDERRNKWAVFIKIDRRSLFIGRFDSLEDAKDAARTARMSRMPGATN